MGCIYIIYAEIIDKNCNNHAYTIFSHISIIPTFELFMMRWEKLGQEKPELATLINPSLEWAEKYYCQMDLTTAYYIAMCRSRHFVLILINF